MFLTEEVDIDKNIGVLNGEKFSLYYANSDCELAFVIPTIEKLNESTKELNDEKVVIEKNQLKLDFIDGVSMTSNSQHVSFNEKLFSLFYLITDSVFLYLK